MTDLKNEKFSECKNSKFIFITGGVLSSLGKGLVAASTGCVLKEYGFSVKIKKMSHLLIKQMIKNETSLIRKYYLISFDIVDLDPTTFYPNDCLSSCTSIIICSFQSASNTFTKLQGENSLL